MKFYEVCFYTLSDGKETMLVYASDGSEAKRVAEQSEVFCQHYDCHLLDAYDLSRWFDHAIERAKAQGEARHSIQPQN